MIVLPDRAIYLCTPRTGSRTVVAAGKLAGGIAHPIHHACVEEVERAKKKHNLSTITVLRDPAYILLSFWWSRHIATPGRTTFERFIEEDFMGIFKQRRIYPYHEVTDEYFPFDIPALFKHLGLPTDNIPEHGVRKVRPDPSFITPRARRLIEKHFAQDMRIYEENNALD